MRMNMQNEFLSSLATILREYTDTFFGPRPHLNDERWEVLKGDRNFNRRLEEIRVRERIPILSLKDDIWVHWITIDDASGDGTDISGSHFMDSLSATKRRRIERAMKSILYDFSLPLNFKDFIQGMLLYRKASNGMPRYNWDFLDQILENPAEARRLPISTAEKKFWLRFFRRHLGISPTGKPKREHAAILKRLKNVLDSSPKNRARRMRTFDSALEATRCGSLKLAVKSIPEKETTARAERRLATTLRQRKSRLLKRHSALKRKAEN